MNVVFSISKNIGKDAIRPFLTDDPIQAFKNVESINLTALITFANRVSQNIRYFINKKQFLWLTSLGLQEGLFFETAQSLRPDLVDEHLEKLDMQLPIHGFNLTHAQKVIF